MKRRMDQLDVWSVSSADDLFDGALYEDGPEGYDNFDLLSRDKSVAGLQSVAEHLLDSGQCNEQKIDLYEFSDRPEGFAVPQLPEVSDPWKRAAIRMFAGKTQAKRPSASKRSAAKRPLADLALGASGPGDHRIDATAEDDAGPSRVVDRPRMRDLDSISEDKEQRKIAKLRTDREAGGPVRRSGRLQGGASLDEDEIFKNLGIDCLNLLPTKRRRSPMDPAALAALREKRLAKNGRSRLNGKDSGLGVRRQGGRVYDSRLGVTCHWCRQKTVEVHVECTAEGCRGGARLPVAFCRMCLRNRHGEDIELAIASNCWVCPACRGSCGPGCTTCCNCGPCRKKAGLSPTHQLIKQARDTGFDNVHDYLIYRATGESAEEIAHRKTTFSWGACMGVAFEEDCTEKEKASLGCGKRIAHDSGCVVPESNHFRVTDKVEHGPISPSPLKRPSNVSPLSSVPALLPSRMQNLPLGLSDVQLQEPRQKKQRQIEETTEEEKTSTPSDHGSSDGEEQEEMKTEEIESDKEQEEIKEEEIESAKEKDERCAEIIICLLTTTEELSDIDEKGEDECSSLVR